MKGIKRKATPDHSEPKVSFKLIKTEVNVAVQLNQLGFFFKKAKKSFKWKTLKNVIKQTIIGTAA